MVYVMSALETIIEVTHDDITCNESKASQSR